jgi:hypothetical protein
MYSSNYNEIIGDSPLSSKKTAHKLVDEYSQLLFRYMPGFATAIGIHDYDQDLPPSSSRIWEEYPAEAKAWKGRLLQVDQSTLSHAEQEDLHLLSKSAELLIFRGETLQYWRKNPSYALWIASWQVEMQFQRNFAPYTDRIRNIIALLSQIPSFLPATRDWLQNPVKLWTKRAIASAEGIPKLYDSIVKTSEDRVPSATS